MYGNPEPLNDGIDTARHAGDNGVRAVRDTIDRVSHQAHEWREEADPAVQRLGQRASELARNSADWARESGQRVRSSVTHASDRTVGYVRDEPVRSMLMAAAAGALIVALVRMIGRQRDH